MKKNYIQNQFAYKFWNEFNYIMAVLNESALFFSMEYIVRSRHYCERGITFVFFCVWLIGSLTSLIVNVAVRMLEVTV